MAIATVNNLRTSLLRDLTEVEAEFAEELLERAERLLQSQIPNLLPRAHAANSARFHATVADVEAEMVARVLRAPGIYLSEGEGEYTYRLNLKVASGLLDVLPDELRKLGVTGYGSIMPETDGYARSRYSVSPPWRFQFSWGDEAEGMAEQIYP